MDWEHFYNSFRQADFIPGYEIQNRLGGGAFGEVYKARKVSIGKPYAIKFLRVEDDSQRAIIERELDQVRHFAAIDHPNLVTIEDMGVALGVPWLLMGYAGEDTLAKRLRAGDLDGEKALSYFVQVCRGVLALHDRRLVHFDLKPSNVFLKGDSARVGDYGLAKLMGEGSQTLSFGRGTPHYMAPEMLRNRADHRADIYSLGVILYESLTGRLPYGDEHRGSGVFVREDDAPPPFPADFPLGLRATAEGCLRLDPAHRFASVHELLESIGQAPRPGDSIVLGPLISGERMGTAPAPQNGFGSHAGGDGAESGRPRTAEELRTTAAEFTRGAVEVARGVLDGVRGRSAEAPPAEAPPAAARPSIDAPDVISVQTLAQPDPVPAARPAVTIPAGDLHGRAGRAQTVPVPPRTEGGVVGTLFATVALGIEVMVSLFTGPVRQAAKGVGRAGDRVIRGVPGACGGALRLIAFFTVLFVVGALLTFFVVSIVLGIPVFGID